MSSTSGIQGELLEVTVVGCFNLNRTKKPFVCLRYGNTEFCTKTCTDGGTNPVFQDKFVFPLIDGFKELYLVLKNHKRIIPDNFICSGIVYLGNVLSRGFDDRRWPLQNKEHRAAGEVQVLLRYPNSPRPSTEFHCVPSPMHHHHVPSAPPLAPAATYAPHYPSYPPPSPAAYRPQPYSPTSAYTPPPPPWCPPPRTAAYPDPQPDPRTSTYPPPPAPSYNPSGSHPRMYPAPPY